MYYQLETFDLLVKSLKMLMFDLLVVLQSAFQFVLLVAFQFEK